MALALLAAVEAFRNGLRAEDRPAPGYEQDIRPIFARRCTVCHSARKRRDPEVSGGLALDSLEAILAGTSRRPVIVPGRSADSELVRRLADADEDRRMPLQDQPLPDPQQALIRRWIDAGAPRGIPTPVANVPAAPPAGGGPARLSRRGPARDVVLATNGKVAPKPGSAAGAGPLEVALPIGPLPAVTSLAFRGDDRLLAVGTYGQVVLWDLYDGRPSGAIREIPGSVHALAFSRDGRRLAVGAGLPARSGIARVYSVPDGTLLHDFEGHEDVVFGLALRPDGTQLASASFDQTVRVWDLALDRPRGVFRGHSDFVYAVAYSPDGRVLLTAGKDRTIKRIDARTLREERTYSGHDQDVLALAVHPDGSRFVSAGEEAPIRWWAIDGEKPLARRAGHSGPVYQLAFSGDGRRLISAGGDRSVRLWDARDGAALRQLAGPTEWQYAAAITDDARLAAAGGWDGLVRLWDAGTGRLLATLVQPSVLASPGQHQAESLSPGLEALSTTGHSASRIPHPIAWFAACPAGYVDGSTELVRAAKWRGGGALLDSQAARAATVRPDLLARSMRGEAVAPLAFPQDQRE